MMTDLKRLSEAPVEGYYMIYTRQAVITGSYRSLTEAVQLLHDNSKDVILEAHFFDAEKEYRIILSTSRRFSGYIEYVADFKSDNDKDILVDRTLLDKETQNCVNMNRTDESAIRVLKVLNKVSYDENGMAYIDDYRLVMEVE